MRLYCRYPAIACLLFLLIGCASVGFQPLTVGQVVNLHESGVPETDLIEQVRTSGTIYRLSGRQSDALQSEGMLPTPVIAAMEQTFTDAVASDPTLEDWDRYWFRDDGYWYGDCPLAQAGIVSLSCG